MKLKKPEMASTMLTSNMVIDMALATADVSVPDIVPFRGNLDLLVASINQEAHLRPEALLGVCRQLASGLRNRLEVSDWVAQYPEIRDEVIADPIFLTGLPRSGTTYFQYLFDPEPSMRMLRYWEGDRPCPPPGMVPESVAGRIKACAEEKANAQRTDALSAKIAQIHLSDAAGPEECLEIIDQTFVNVGYMWPFRVPGYFAACLETDRLLESYQYHKLVLQLLQWNSAPRRWVLKWPCHLVALDEIVTVHPEAKFVVTHRDPIQALASNCSLATMLRQGSSEQVDPYEVGQQMKDMLLVYLRRLVDFDARQGHRIAHVAYQTAVDQPQVAMAQALGTLGIAMTPSFEGAIVEWRNANPPGKRGAHHYTLEDYGLDADELAETFAFYVDRFDIPPELEGKT